MGKFTEPVASILAEYSSRLLPLTRSEDCHREHAQVLRQHPPGSLFPDARQPEAALAGLMLLIGCWEDSHQLAQDISSTEGSYWHAIVHRMEPDSSNSAYWFRRTGAHPIFTELHREASEILHRAGASGWRLKQQWDPMLFLTWCDEARQQAGSPLERAACEIQQAEWRLLFDWCALPANPASRRP